MSDIPLRSLRNSRRAGYTPLNGDPQTDNSQMPAHVQVAATAYRSSTRIGKRRERYTDEEQDEEGAALLGGGEQDGGFDDEFQDGGKSGTRPKTPISQGRSSSILSRRGAPSKDKSRTIPFRPPDKLQARFPPNIVRNQKYNAFTFLPIVFYEQFKFFFNLYFLLVALSQFIPALKIGESHPTQPY